MRRLLAIAAALALLLAYWHTRPCEWVEIDGVRHRIVARTPTTITVAGPASWPKAPPWRKD